CVGQAPHDSELPASSGMRGVGPAERTGKSSVRYCPGGSCRPLSRLRPRKPLLPLLMGIASCKRQSDHTMIPRAAAMGNLPKSACHRCWDGEVGTVLRQLDPLYYFLAHPKTLMPQ